MSYKSRSEHYLAYLSGMAPDYPNKPLSRVEWYLDYLCKHGSGSGGGDIEEIKQEIERIKAEIKELQLFKFPNVTIIGTPKIDNGQVSGFSVSNYMQFPFVMDFRSKPFTIDMCFTTGDDVVTQQNIFDSKFGMAFAIINRHFVLAISTTGTNWDLGALTGTYTVQPDTTYYVRLSWDGSKYTIEYSLDAVSYTTDASINSSVQPSPKTIIIGVGDIESSHPEPFLGTINLNRAYLSVNGEVFWQGMDDAGIGTRLAVDMSNLDDAGMEVVRGLSPVKDVQAGGISIVEDGVANIPIGAYTEQGLMSAWQNYGINVSNGRLYIYSPVELQIVARTGFGRAGFGAINTANVVVAVNSVLCSTSATEQLTAEQQIAAQIRLGIRGIEGVGF